MAKKRKIKRTTKRKRTSYNKTILYAIVVVIIISVLVFGWYYFNSIGKMLWVGDGGGISAWNKNPELNNYDYVNTSLTDTSQKYEKFYWDIRWDAWKETVNRYRNGRGFAFWSANGKLTLDVYLNDKDPAWYFNSVMYGRARQSVVDCPTSVSDSTYPYLTRFRMGNYPNANIVAKYKLDSWQTHGAFDNCLFNVWW